MYTVSSNSQCDAVFSGITIGGWGLSIGPEVSHRALGNAAWYKGWGAYVPENRAGTMERGNMSGRQRLEGLHKIEAQEPRLPPRSEFAHYRSIVRTRATPTYVFTYI